MRSVAVLCLLHTAAICLLGGALTLQSLLMLTVPRAASRVVLVLSDCTAGPADNACKRPSVPPCRPLE